MSAWHVDPVQARGLCLHLVPSSAHWGLSHPAWLAAGVSLHISYPRCALLRGRPEQGHSAPAPQDRGGLLANSGKRDARHRRVSPGGCPGRRKKTGDSGVAGPLPRPPASLQEYKTPAEQATGRKAPAKPTALFKNLRLAQNDSTNGASCGGVNRSQLKTLSFVNYSPNLLGL